MLILRGEHHSSAIWQVLHKIWATLIMLNTSSWIFLKKLPMEAYSWCAGNDFKKISLHPPQVSNILFCKERQNWKPIYSGCLDALCSTRKNRNWCKRKSSNWQCQSCFFVCTTFDSFLNDLAAATSQEQSGWNGAVGMERRATFP